MFQLGDRKKPVTNWTRAPAVADPDFSSPLISKLSKLNWTHFREQLNSGFPANLLCELGTCAPGPRDWEHHIGTLMTPYWRAPCRLWSSSPIENSRCVEQVIWQANGFWLLFPLPKNPHKWPLAALPFTSHSAVGATRHEMANKGRSGGGQCFLAYFAIFVPGSK